MHNHGILREGWPIRCAQKRGGGEEYILSVDPRSGRGNGLSTLSEDSPPRPQESQHFGEHEGLSKDCRFRFSVHWLGESGLITYKVFLMNMPLTLLGEDADAECCYVSVWYVAMDESGDAKERALQREGGCVELWRGAVGTPYTG